MTGNWHSNPQRGAIKLCLFIASHLRKVQEEAFSTFLSPSEARYNQSFFVLPGAIVFVLMVSQSHCNCIHFHSGGFITFHRLKLEFALLRLITANDILVPVGHDGRRCILHQQPKLHYQQKRDVGYFISHLNLLLHFYMFSLLYVYHNIIIQII